MKKVICFLSCIILLMECDSSEDPSLNAYLPLQIGNSWTFDPIGNIPAGYYSFKRVTGKVNLDGHSYYAIVSGYANPTETISDTTYYRMTFNGFVYSRRKESTIESNKFRLKGRDGDTWSYLQGDYTTDVVLSVITLNIANEELKNCKAFYYDVSRFADDEHSVTLAPGIGFIKEYSYAWNNGTILKSAVINGRTFNF